MAEVGVPLRPMLGKITRDLSEVFTTLEGREFTCEFKYDGQVGIAFYHCIWQQKQYYIFDDLLSLAPNHPTFNSYRELKSISTLLARSKYSAVTLRYIILLPPCYAPYVSNHLHTNRTLQKSTLTLSR